MTHDAHRRGAYAYAVELSEHTVQSIDLGSSPPLNKQSKYKPSKLKPLAPSRSISTRTLDWRPGHTTTTHHLLSRDSCPCYK